MKHDPFIFADVLREQGFETHKIRRILHGEGYGHEAIADATVPPRSLDERIERLRAAGASIRTTAACVGVSKSKLHYMLSPEMRERHNKRATGRKYKMKDEHVVQLLMACGELTRAIDEHKAALDSNAATIADAIQQAGRTVAAKLGTANELAKRR